MGKRVLATLLSVAMLLSLTIVPVGAASDEDENVPTVTLETVSFTEADVTGFTEGEPKTDVRPDETIAVKSILTNTTDTTIWFTGFSQKLSYDSSVFEFYTFKYKPKADKNNTTKIGPIIGKASETDIPADWNGVQNSDTEGVAIWNGTGIEPIELAPGNTLTLGYVLLKAKTNIENGNYDIHFNLENDNNYIKSSPDESGTNDTNIQGIDFSENNKATLSVVDGVTPTVSTVTLAPSTVTVNGTNKQTVQAKATSAKGTDLTNSVTWSIGTPENGGGVSIAKNGTITVAANAKAGEYTVYANKNSSGGGGGSGSINRSQSAAARSEVQGSAQTTLTVSRETSVAKELAISAEKSMVEIPTDDKVATATFTAAFRDQYREEMTAPSVTWSITPSVNGVSINNGVVTVNKNAKNEISNSTEFTITATSGDLTQDSKLTVKRAAAQAKSIELGTVNDMTVPVDGANAETATVTATVKDQYDTPISNPTVAWSIAPADKGVSIDTTGKITVTNAAKEYIKDTTGQQFTVTAKSGDVTKTATVTVKRAASTATSMKVFKGDVELTGNTDTVIIPSTSTPNTYTYSAKVYDQYGSGMSETATISFTATTETDKVTYADGTVTVKQGATKDSTYTLTVSYSGLTTQTITITAKDIDITWPTVSKKDGTYGDKWSDIVKYSGGSAMLNVTKVEGAFELKDASSVPDVGATYQFVFKSTDGTYTVESAPQTANIAQKELTITAGSASKQYDGKALTKNAVTDCTVTGLVNDDVLTAVTVNGSATNVADTATGNNKVSAATIKHGDVDKTTNYNISYVNGTLTITKAHLTIKANDKTITYGEAANNGGVTYTGLVNSEVGTTVAPVEYEYNYKQYDNIGEYVITPKGATEANYKITYRPGKLTVGQKEVTLTWEPIGENPVLYYDGNAKDVTATVGGTVNSDAITATVVGGKESAIGQYTAKVTALTGEKAGNYTRPTTNLEKTYQIKSALNASDLTVTPNTVTATIDGLTIKLVGYASTDVTVLATNATVSGDKLTIHGVDYTIDRTGVKSIGDKVTVANSDVSVVLPTDASNDLKAVDNDTTTVSGLNNALADLLAKAGENLPKGATKVEVKAILRIQPVSYDAGKSLKLNIKPEIQYTYKDASDTQVGEIKTLPVDNSDIKAPVTISVYLPDSFAPNFAKHGSEWLPVTTSNRVATWKQSSFSEVELVSDTRSATVNFTFEDGHSQRVTYGPADIGKTFPTDSKDGYTFNGWTIGGKTYTTLTDEALTELSSVTDKNAKASFTQKSNNGGNHGGSGGSGVSTYPVSVTTPKNGKVSVDPRNAAKGAAVTVTVTPDSGYEMDKLTVTDASGKTISTTDKGNGKFTFTMPNGKVSVSATFKQTTLTPPSTGFVDVPASAYYADAVKWAVEKGITTGTSATTFSPEASCTRAQMVTFLWRAAGSPAPKATTTAFTDLDKSAYYYDAVLWAVEQGITTGTSATTFSPNATVTRGQTVTFLYRFAGQPAVSGSSSFTDVNSSDYYAAAVQWAKEQGITSGTTATTFSPTNDCTRGQIVTFLYRQLAK